jgi:hypothetical protein
VFDAARPLQDGIVFIDTTDGRAPPPGGGTLAAARLDAGAVAAPDGVFRGWIIVNGRLEITAPVHLRGLVHVADTLTYRAPGQGSLEGLVVALGAQQPAVWLEALAGGALSLAFDCRHAGGAGAVPHGFALVPGTYREERD